MKVRVAVIAALCATAGVVAGATIVSAATGTPEIDRANATMQLAGQLSPMRCTGEDGAPYVTYLGSWRGGETQMGPATDYPLSGSLTIGGIQWTINLKTQRGVLLGQANLTNAAGGPVYSGRLTLVTQGLPVAGALVPGRGWIVAGFKLPDEGATTAGDDNLIANVEFKINPGGANGQFGDVPGSLNIPDYSVVTNVAPTPQDGIC